MEKQRNIKILTIIALIISILCLSVALATVSSTIEQKQEIIVEDDEYTPIIPETNKQTTTKNKDNVSIKTTTKNKGNVSIKTTTKASSIIEKQEAIWSVRFKNLSKPILNGTTKVEKEFSVKNNSTIIEGLNVMFLSPNDSIVYTFDVANEGNLKAKIGNLVKFNPICNSMSNNKDDELYVCKNIKYTLIYTENGKEVKKEDELDAKTSKNLTLEIEYIGNKLPINKVEISNLSIVLIYVQK